MSNISCELLCVQMFCENEEFVRKLESEIDDQYIQIRKEVCKYDQLQGLNKLFNSKIDISFPTLFANAFGCAGSNSEMYHAIREIFFKTMFTCQRIVIFLNRTAGAIETGAITLISFYKFMLKGSKQKNTANCIFEQFKEFQSQSITASVLEAAKEVQSLISSINKNKLKYLEHEMCDKLYKLLQPLKIMQFCLDELSNTNHYMDMYYNILQNALFEDNCANGDTNADTAWENSTTSKLFLKYFSSVLASRLLCLDFVNEIEQLRDNFRCMIHNLPCLM